MILSVYAYDEVEFTNQAHIVSSMFDYRFLDDAHSVELTQFKEQFKSHLRELIRHVSQIFLLAQVTNITNFTVLSFERHCMGLFVFNIQY